MKRLGLFFLIFWLLPFSGIAQVPTDTAGTRAMGFNLLVPSENPETGNIVIGYDVLHPGQYSIEISHPSDRIVLVKSWRETQRGRHQLVWNKRNDRGGPVEPGTYTITMKDRYGSQSREVIIQDGP